MRNLILIGFSFILINLGCDSKKFKPGSFKEICKLVIDKTIIFDNALNEGDSLYLDFSNDLDLNNSDKSEIIDYVNKKFKYKVGLSSLQSLISNDTIFKTKFYLKNFFISIDELQFINSKKISIKSQKYKGSLAAIVVETIFEFKDKKWRLKSSMIISAS